MPGFGKIVHVVNRSLLPLEVMDDGIPWPIRPGYIEKPVVGDDGPVLDEAGEPVTEIVGAGPGGTVYQEPLPYFAAERAKRQNPVMGTEDPWNPNSFESLIAIPAWGEDYSPLNQTEAIERLDRSQLPAESQNIKVIAGRGQGRAMPRKNPKTGKFEKVVSNARAVVQGEARENLTGMRLND
ncbi:MAG: hypothetical protein ABWY78_06215 [Microvirga sp.]